MEPTAKKQNVGVTPKNPMNMDTGAEIQPKQLLPDDLVLEIVARCGTIGDAIRCAATSRSLRRGILHAPFLRHLRGFLNLDNGGEHGDDGRPPFIPTLLLGLYHHQSGGDPRLQPSFVPASDGARLPPSLAALPSPPNDDRDDDDAGACDFGAYLPVASRRSLLVLRRRCKSTAKEHLIERHGLHPVELSVCNPTTRERCVLPPHDVQDMSHALLDAADPMVVGAPSSSFKLLVAELSSNNASTLYVQIFSSSDSEEGGWWGPALACPIVSRFSDSETRFELACSAGTAGHRRPMPVVLGDTVYWLCASRVGHRILVWRWRGGVARDAGIADLPRGYWGIGLPEKCLAVLPSPADAAGSQPQALLGLIGIHAGAIEVWACEKSGGASATAGDWKLWRRIQEETIPLPWPMGFSFSSRWLRDAEISWFCEGSGTLFLRPRDGRMSRLLFCLDTMKVSKLDARAWGLNPEPDFCPYEVDLLSHMLFVMKHF